MPGYDYSHTPGVAGVKTKLHTIVDFSEEDTSILNTPVVEDLDNIDDINTGSVLEHTGYDPAIGNIGSPINPNNVNTTPPEHSSGDNSLINPEVTIHSAITTDPKTLLLGDDDSDKLDVASVVDYVPSDVVDYYNETALRSADRNKLNDDDFGLPRLRKFPLHDRKHVQQAIRMFHFVKDPKDRKTLAKNIVLKHDALEMSVKVGKSNPLYDYVPVTMQETVLVKSTMNFENDDMVQKKASERTKQDIIKEHLKTNSLFYNNLFYTDDFSKTLKGIKEFEFLNYFYPSFKNHNLYSRIVTSLGGFGSDRGCYKMFGLPYPLDGKVTKLSKPNMEKKRDDIELYLSVNYDCDSNWYKTDANDPEHIYYCLRLYVTLAQILNDSNYTNSVLDDYYKIAVLSDWETRVQYHHALLQECEEYSDAYFVQCQYLHDLMWDPMDNPSDENVIASNIISVVRNMKSEIVTNMNESGELVSKTDLVVYLIRDLGYEDDIFLLPDTLEYPIIDADSVRMAMDNITNIDHDNILTYTSNLNRKYHELGCTFAISVDHPYAKYASDEIVDKMNRILVEADDAVSDYSDSVSSEDGPWYKTLNWGYYSRNFFDNKELGPNNSDSSEPPDLRGSSTV